MLRRESLTYKLSGVNVTDEGWQLVPDFSARLQAAMDYAGLDIRQVVEGLRSLGVGSSPTQVHRLLKGSDGLGEGPRKRANPTFVTIAALAAVCRVPVEWFFSRHGELSLLLGRYEDRVEQEV